MVLPENLVGFSVELTTTPTVVYTAPAPAILFAAEVCNKVSNNRDVWLGVDRGSGVRWLRYEVRIKDEEFLSLLSKIALQPGDQLVAYASHASALDLTASVLELAP